MALSYCQPIRIWQNMGPFF